MAVVEADDPTTSPLTSPILQPRPSHRAEHTSDNPFAFPQLNTDGSVDDLTAHTSRRYPPTPPAALSSLGAKARTMAAAAEHSHAGANSSSSGPVEEPYDMIDDLSEISNDDHETASIGSNDQEHGGLMTPNLESDVEDSVASLGINSVADMASSTQSFMLPTAPSSAEPTPLAATNMPNPLAEVKSANDLIDSYTSEDLDTPRQSTVATAFQSTWRQALHRANTGSSPRSPLGVDDEEQPSKRILFIASSAVSRQDMEIILTQVTAGLANTAVGADTLTVSRLPATPSGIKLPSTTVVTSEHRIAAVVQHCIGLDPYAASSVQLQIRDAYGTHLEPLPVAKNAGVDMNFPDIIVVYAYSAFDLDSLELAETLSFFEELPVPKLVVADLSTSYRSNKMDVTRTALPCTLVKIKSLRDASQARRIAEQVAALSYDENIQQRVEQVQKKSFPAQQKTRPVQTRINLDMVSIALALLSMALCLSQFWPLPTDPAKIISHRREALSAAVAQAIDISIADSKTCDIEHLVPELPHGCASTVIFGRELIAPACATDVRFQGINPNHILISLPGQRRFPSTTAAQVWRHDDPAEQLHFNLTQLIPGVYSVTLDPSEAYGPVHVNILTRSPQLNITLAHHFGSRILHRQTYQAVGKEVSQAVGKDVAVIRHAAKSLTDKLALELAAGLRATQNVTTSLALSAVQDFQTVAKTAGSLLRRTAAAGNETVVALTKDLVVLQKDIVQFVQNTRNEIRSKLAELKSESKSRVRKPLKESRSKLAQLRKAAQGRVDETLGHAQPADPPVEKPAKITSLMPIRGDSSHQKSGPASSSASSAENLQRTLNRAERKLAAMQRRYALEEEKVGAERLGKKELRQLRKEMKKQEKEVARAGRAVREAR